MRKVSDFMNKFNFFQIFIFTISFMLCSCDVNNFSSEESGQVECIYLEKDKDKVYLCSDIFSLHFSGLLKANICDDGVFIQKDNAYINLNKYSYGWHKLIIQDSEKSYEYFIHRIPNVPNVLISKESINIGRRLKQNVYAKKYKNYMQEKYSVTDCYFGCYGTENNYSYYDNYGIPLVDYSMNGGVEYNITTIAQYALSFYSNIKLISISERESFLNIADFICDYINKDGGAPYNFDFDIHGIKLKKPWYSAMAQGQVLSVLARAYLITNDNKYLEKGNSVFEFMINSCSTNLLMFTNKHKDAFLYGQNVIYEEYVSDINSYVLNGDLFALIGLYEWYEVTNDKDVLSAFNKGCESILFLLPYYDYNGFTSYDLVHFTLGSNMNYGTSYSHDWHIVLLDALYFYTKNEIFRYYRDKFISYIDDNNFYGELD